MLDWVNVRLIPLPVRSEVTGEVEMASNNTVTFQEALEVVESLPEYQQEDLIEIIRKRRLERRRESLIENIKEAEEEYARGEFTRGSAEDLMREISE
jgi:hypothetical protein